MKAIPNEKHQQLLVPFRKDIANVIHTAKKISWKGKDWLAVPWRPTETQLLSNLGVHVPTVVMAGYDWAGNVPFDSQIKTANMLVKNRRAYVLNSLGTGKTCSALFAFDYLLKNDMDVNKCLVVAPLSTLNAVWANELFSRFNHISHVVLHGSRAKRISRLATGCTVDIINQDGVKVLQKELLAKDYDVVIIDELASYRNARTDRWKMLKPIVQKAKYAWGLTGLPTPNEPTDAWAQCRLLTPQTVPFSARAFKLQTMSQVSQFRWVPKADANDIVFEAMQPSVRFTRDQCFDLPPTTYSTRHVDLTPEQMKAYKNMASDFAIQVKNKEITAANEGVKISKLLQIASGFVYDREGKPTILKTAPRFKMLLEVIEETDGKVIVFTPFKFGVRMLFSVLEQQYGKGKVAQVSGDTPQRERADVFTKFQSSVNPQVLVAHPQCMAHGVNLHTSNTIVWFAPHWSSEIYVQGNGRITRAGQKRHTHVIHFESTAAERKVYNRLQGKQKMSGLLLDMFKDGTMEI